VQFDFSKKNPPNNRASRNPGENLNFESICPILISMVRLRSILLLGEKFHTMCGQFGLAAVGRLCSNPERSQDRLSNMQQVLHRQPRDEIKLDSFSWKAAPHDSMPLR
jgi:hypothetical protein